jgi:hypothetical protein
VISIEYNASVTSDEYSVNGSSTANKMLETRINTMMNISQYLWLTTFEINIRYSLSGSNKNRDFPLSGGLSSIFKFSNTDYLDRRIDFLWFNNP